MPIFLNGRFFGTPCMISNMLRNDKITDIKEETKKNHLPPDRLIAHIVHHNPCISTRRQYSLISGQSVDPAFCTEMLPHMNTIIGYLKHIKHMRRPFPPSSHTTISLSAANTGRRKDFPRISILYVSEYNHSIVILL